MTIFSRQGLNGIAAMKKAFLAGQRFFTSDEDEITIRDFKKGDEVTLKASAPPEKVVLFKGSKIRCNRTYEFPIDRQITLVV